MPPAVSWAELCPGSPGTAPAFAPRPSATPRAARSGRRRTTHVLRRTAQLPTAVRPSRGLAAGLSRPGFALTENLVQLTTLLDRLNEGSSQSWPLAEETDELALLEPTPLAPCQDAEDPDLWFAERQADVEFAKTLCRTCPVREACLAGALEPAEPWGVWGGEVFIGGEVVATKRGRGRPRKHHPAA
ncbi:WhiB family transcriptional regulator [Actinomycetaceae bacterium Sa1BUA1]|uniref:Transcriptional regulator WhiB n=1 Tax=Oceanitalea stevensii TaxID=2763072 RepID=A0ABR8Z4A7_9MICO|nr:WhiB family transcriptional regulator [Oceanitalea stevensii]